MNKIDTKYHGIREYEEEDIINFNRGIPGFENLKKFIIFPLEDNDVFNILHSVEDESVGFVVVSPFTILKDYEFDLSEEKTEELQIESFEDVLVFNTVTLSSEIKNLTTNLQAPIVINIKKHIGEQIILNDGKYSIKHPLFKEE